VALIIRLIEYAPTYYDLASLTDGETKRALQRVVNKRAGKGTGRVDAVNDTRETKRRKKNNNK
jgi:pre-mRNA-splicing factor ATP-dependent RNA helicase DHX15/PRP43